MGEISKEARIKEFLYLIWKSLGNKVTGGFSFPFYLAGIIVAWLGKTNYDLPISLSLISIGMLSTFYGVWSEERKNRRVKETELVKLKDPGFDVEFKYEEESFYHQGINRSENGELFNFELYRIAVKNHHAPQDIKVRIIAIEDSNEFEGRLPLPLQFQHDTTAAVRSVKLAANERVFVDVVMQAAMTTRGFMRFIKHSVPGVPQQINAGRFKLKIAIIGERDTIEKWFLVSHDIDAKLGRLFKMELLPNHEATNA
ncbi:MAG TPA: hypothetical protein VFH55_04775 [Nitrospiria bacterium]|nr:hypothetical protein [Nitrospiria bacterium]